MNLASSIPYGSWSVITADFLILLHLTIGGVTLSALLHLASAKWRYKVRDVAVSFFALWPLVLLLMIVLFLFQGHVFLWRDFASAADGEAHPLNGWHNPTFFWLREFGGFLFIVWLYRRFIRLQEVSERSEEDWNRFKAIANWIPVAHVVYGTMVGWDYEMTMVPSWESSVYGMYHFVSNFGMFLATLLATLYVLDRAGRLANPVPDYIFNYLSQMMLAFTILWTYLWFAQYLTIWYGNITEERVRIDSMVRGDYSVLWWTFFSMRFLIPFCLLVFTDVRHSPVWIFRIALVMIAGTWIERFTWIAGSLDIRARRRPNSTLLTPFVPFATGLLGVLQF